MTITVLKELLLWSAAINYGVLLLWFLLFVAGHDWIYQLHTRWFRLSAETFDAIHYAGMAVYKLGILLLNLVPLAALYLA
jgi:hypothetical protein